MGEDQAAIEGDDCRPGGLAPTRPCAQHRKWRTGAPVPHTPPPPSQGKRMSPEIQEIEARNLNDRLPRGIHPFIAEGERALIIIPGVPGAIVATNQRVIVERMATPMQPQVFPYRALTGAVAHLKLFGRRFAALAGPGLDPDPGAIAIGRSRNATVVQVWRLGATRQAVAELNELIATMNARPATAGADGEQGVTEADQLNTPAAFVAQSSRTRPSMRLLAIGVVIVVAVAAAAVLLAPKGSGDTVTDNNTVASDAGTIVFSDDFHDAKSGWDTTPDASGNANTYTNPGFQIHAEGVAQGAFFDAAYAPYDVGHRQISVSATGTLSPADSKSAGFGVVCYGDTKQGVLGYAFVSRTDGSWVIVRLSGNSANDTLKQGSAATGGGPLTLQGSCATLSDGRSTRLLLYVNGTQVADFIDRPDSLPSGGWFGGVVVVVQTKPADAHVTQFAIRSLSK